MTKEEIDRLLDFISQMVNDDFNEEDYFNFAEELINKYAPGEDIEQAMQDTNFLKGIIARTESKLLDYFEERGYEIEGELLTQLKNNFPLQCLDFQLHF